MKIMFYVVASLAILPILGVSYFILRSFQNNRVKLNEIAARIGGKLKGGITTIGYIEGVYNTKKIKISLAWPSQYTPSKLIIELFKTVPKGQQRRFFPSWTEKRQFFDSFPPHTCTGKGCAWPSAIRKPDRKRPRR